MAVIGYVGQVGSGKTANMMVGALSNFRNARIQYSNVNILGIEKGIVKEKSIFNWCMWILRLDFATEIIPYSNVRYFYEPEQMQEISVGTIYIDEIHTLFDAHDRRSLPRNVRNNITQQRKQGIDIIYTTQQIPNVARYLRKFNQELHFCSHINLNPFHLFQSRLVSGLEINNESGEPRDYAAIEHKKPKRLFMTNARLSRLYDTYALIKPTKTLGELNMKKKKAKQPEEKKE